MPSQERIDQEKAAGHPLDARILNGMYFAASLSIIITFTFALSAFFGVWGNLIARADTAAHMTKVRFILENWPHFRWGDIWAAGFPMFLWYAPLPYLILSALAILVGSIELGFSISIMLSVILIASGIFLFVRENGGGNLASLLAAVLAVASPALWVYGLKGGLYPRLITLGFWPLTLWLAQRWSRAHYVQRAKSRGKYLAFVLSLGVAIQGHLLIGAIVAISVALLLVLTVPGFNKKIDSLARAFVPAFGLSAAFYVPFFLTNPSARFLGLRVPSLPLEFQNLLFDQDKSPYDGEALFALVSPLFVGSLIAYVKHRRTASFHSKQVLSALLLITLACFLFAFAGHFGWPSTWYINGFPPGESSIFLAVILPTATGILAVAFGRRRRAILLSALLITLTLSIALYSPLNPKPWIGWSAHANDQTIPLTMNGTVINSIDVNYRYGTDWDRAAIWFNFKYPISQTRDYYGQGVLIEDWRFWFEKAVWVDLGNYNETNYAFDWFAIRWFSVSVPHYHFAKFLQAPAYYELINNISDPNLELSGQKFTFHEFEYLDATPILSASNAPAVLVIGSSDAYSVFFRSLAYTDFDSQHVIPVEGSAYIDDYTTKELAQFDSVFLYGYQYHNKAQAFKMLEDYVRDGGRVIVDTGLSPQANDKDLPDLFPVNSLDSTNFGTAWNFSSVPTPITNGIRFQDFSPAVYSGTYPWGISVAANSSVRNWASPILFDWGHPVAATGNLGKGLVVWVGINLPYHTESFKNPEESHLLANILQSSMVNNTHRTEYVIEKNNPENQSLRLDQVASGVLLKESIFDNWHAYAIDAHGIRLELQIFEAGPSFMYARLPQQIPYPVTVTFVYGISWPEYLGFFATASTIMILFLYAAFGDRLWHPLTDFAAKQRRRWNVED